MSSASGVANPGLFRRAALRAPRSDQPLNYERNLPLHCPAADPLDQPVEISPIGLLEFLRQLSRKEHLPVPEMFEHQLQVALEVVRGDVDLRIVRTQTGALSQLRIRVGTLAAGR